MGLTLPPDPYKILGVAKDAKLPDIRSAHRKLVIKCHPDKVQDPAQKSIKQDEFHKVQQAYELLSDDAKRIQYDESVKLFELRKEMGRGNPTPRSNPFEYQEFEPNVRTAEPRPSTYSRAPPAPRPEMYNTTYAPASKSHEELYEIPIPHRTAKKSTSYESNEGRVRPSTRDGERERNIRRQEEEEKMRERLEKERKKAAHSDKKKSRDKEKRRGTEEKHSRAQPYVESDDEDFRAKKSSTRYREEEIRIRTEEAPAYKSPHISPTAPSAPLTPKWDNHKQFASEYMMTAKQKHSPQLPREEFHAPPPIRRAETFDVRHAAPQMHHLSPSDDEAPRRSSGRTTRRSSEDPAARSSKDSRKDQKRSPSSRTREAHIKIVEPPFEPQSPPMQSTMKIPKLHTTTSAPPILPPHVREKPSRSKTHDYPRQEYSMPPLPRAHTFQSGDQGRSRDKSSGSRLKTTMNYEQTDSDSDSPIFVRKSQSPQRRREPPPETKQTRYVVESGRTVPVVSRHRDELRNLDEPRSARERSPSPRSGRPIHHAERPPIHRSTGGSHSSTRQAPQRSQSQSHYPEVIPETRAARQERPKMPGRAEAYFGEVQYAKPVRADNIIYSTDYIRRGSDPSHHGHRENFAYPTAGRGERTALYGAC